MVTNHAQWVKAIVGVRFHGVRSHSFGAPNDESFHGDALARFGLKPYGFARVENSPWIESLRLMNSVHPYHHEEVFAELEHFVLLFHDTTFECVARGYAVETADGADITPFSLVRALLGE